MTDRPILFNAPMVQALFDGRKRQTRRFAKVRKGLTLDDLIEDGERLQVGPVTEYHAKREHLAEPAYAVGDRLWVRETCRAEEWSNPPKEIPATKKERAYLRRTTVIAVDEMDGVAGVRYAADNAWLPIKSDWDVANKWDDLYHYRNGAKDRLGIVVPSIHMPREFSRITLTVTDVRVERLQDISRHDCFCEGVNRPKQPSFGSDVVMTDNARLAFRSLWESINGPGSWEANPWVVALTFDVALRNIDEVTL